MASRVFFVVAVWISVAVGATSAFTLPHGATTTTANVARTGCKPTGLCPSPRKPTASLAQQRKTWSSSSSLQALGDIESYTRDTMGSVQDKKDTLPSNVAALGAFGLVLFGAATWFMQVFLNQGCLADANTCTDQYRQFAEFFVQPVGGGAEHGPINVNSITSFVLILTHAIPFALLPVTMRLVSDKGELIQKHNEDFNPFIMNLGLASIGFGLALEFGWHVSDSWYYVNNFHILNFGFYFFLISGFALWADGFKNTAFWDTVFGLILLAATVLYPIGNYQVAFPDADPILPFLSNPDAAKIPLYVGMTATFAAITLRGQKVFGRQMWIVFFLSVVVNLFFIFKLQELDIGDGEVLNLDVWNYIYHVCHDLLGTEAGVAYFAYLVANYDGPPPALMNKK